MFNELEIAQIRDILNLPTQQLYPGSQLRYKLTEISARDVEYGIQVEQQIKLYLSEITKLDNAIAESDSQTTGAIKKKEIDDEVSIEYFGLKTDNPAFFLRRKREELVLKLYRDLGYKKLAKMAYRTRS